MTRKYQPRKAGKQWRVGAPDYILDCFDNPQFADRYTIWFDKSQAIHEKADGSIGDGPDQFHNTWIRGLGTSETGATSGALEYQAHHVAAYRYANGHRRIKWADLPAATQRLVRSFIESE